MTQNAPVPLACSKCGAVRAVPGYDPSQGYRCTVDGCGGDLVDPAEAETVRSDAPPEVSGAAVDPKNRFGKYVLVRLLGRGGMGTVYKAWDSSLRRWVALKFLLLADSGDDVRRFRREAQTAASLKHPDIAGIYEVGEHDGKPFIAMEYIDGRSLAGLKMGVRRACEVARDVALALEYAHSRSIIHRDLKPGNILLRPDSKPTVLDFGLAKSLTDPSKLTMSGTVVGTPAYMPPESAAGRKDEVDAKSDVYQLGAVLYELVTGRIPFLGDTPAEILKRVIEDDVIRPSQLASVPEDVETIILRAMDKERPRRYASAKAFAADLDRYLHGKPIVARPASTVRRVRRWVGRHQASSIAAAAVTLVLLGTAGFLFLQSSSRAEEAARLSGDADRAYSAKDFRAALELYSRSLELDPVNPHAEKRLADCGKAMEAARAASAKAAAREKARAAARPAYERGLAELEESWRDLYRQGADLVKMRRRLASAVDAFTESLSVFPENPDALFARGRARGLRFEHERADADFKKAAELHPGFVQARAERARLLLQRHIEAKLHMGWIWDEASSRRFSAWKDEARRESGDPAFLAFVEDRLKDCLQECERRLKEKPEQEEVWKLSGDALYFSTGSFAEGNLTPFQEQQIRRAINAYTEAIRLRPNFYEARMMRGYSHLQRGNPKEGLEDVRVAHQLRPDDALACWLMGRAADGPAAALEWYDRGLQSSPDSFICRMNRAASLGQLDRLDEARQELERSIGLNPAHPYPWYLRGAIRSRTDDMEGAYQDLRKTVQLNPNFASAWYNLGAVAFNTRRYKEAVDSFERALQTGHPDRSKVEERIRAARLQAGR